ncbi:hypothetical protein HA402_010415 [Bradysia odoriphaga]|nr:hypothetical protein HA402_010415 [Bradysia odoriphaga]
MNSSLILAVVLINVLEFTVSSPGKVRSDKSNHRIVGGHEVSIKKAPWIVQVIYNKDGLCGGSIISRTKILSAAHCTIGRTRKLFVIRAGTAKLLVGGQIRRTSKIIEHPLYKQDSHQNDICILFLRKRLNLSTRISIIGINKSPSVLHKGSKVTVNGWGLICETCGASYTLRAVKVTTVDNNRCKKMYGPQIKILPSMFCCGLETGGKDSCKGDSGGPVTLGKKLVGVVSFGRGCARPNVPGVYTRVSYFASWIERHL